MDSKNVIAAISLSAAVIILYSLFFAPTTKEIKKVNNENIKKEQSSDTPLLEENENLPKLSREDALNENKRFNFENENLDLLMSFILSSVKINLSWTPFIIFESRFQNLF